jgi:parvulin-like peptidyl-prolyl isomerase
MTRRSEIGRCFRRAVCVSAWALLVAGMTSVLAAAADGGKPRVMEGKDAVASVNGETITAADLLRQVGAFHSGVAESKTRPPDLPAVLDRIVNVKLIVQEARRIGLDQLPEAKERLDSLRLGLMKSLLVRRQVEGISEGEPGTAERIYREMVRELVIDSLLFPKEEDAAAFLARLRSGGDFKTLADAAVAAGRARGGSGSQTMKTADLRPEIARVVGDLKAGETSAPVKVDGGFTIVKLVDVRHPENAQAREEARQQALEGRRQARLEAYMEGLRERYTSVDQRVLKGLDYESKEPGLENLRGDRRVVAQVKGGSPVTVADLTAGVEAKFYHGVEGAIERKRVNEDLPQILDRILLERATVLEARRLGLEKTGEFRDALEDRTEAALFDAFVKKVINPEIKLESAALKKFYDDHAADYSTPEMMRIESLAFRRNQDAQAALDRLRQGADLKWMRDNASGRVDRASSPSILEFKGELTTTASFPEGVRKILTGARAGDVRFYGEPGGPFYILCVRQVVATAPQPYDSVKGDIATRMFALEQKKRIDDWAKKLRAASDVRIFATGKSLQDFLGLGAAGGV